MIFKRSAAIPPLIGTVKVPGDKSLSHRAVILAALAKGRSVVRGVNVGDDVLATAACIEALGAEVVVVRDRERIEITSPGFDALHEPAAVLECGNSGTSIRLLMGVVAGVPGCAVLTGDETLRRRPMLRIVSPLRQMGASIDGRDHGNLAPLTVRGADLVGIDIETSVASAQVKTAVLLAGLSASGVTTVTEPSLSRDHTERMLDAAGVEVTRTGLSVSVTGGARPEPFDWSIPGDPSGAMFLLVAGLTVPGSSVTVENVCLNPTRTAAFDVLREMGGTIEVEESGVSAGEPLGRVTASYSELGGVDIDEALVPSLIDEVPALLIAAGAATGTTTLRGAAELRVKESDRIDAMVTGLRSLGTTCEEFEDGIAVTGGSGFGGGEIDPRGDHRIAMAFAVAGLTAREKVRVSGWSCVDTSFPGFLDVLGEAQGP